MSRNRALDGSRHWMFSSLRSARAATIGLGLLVAALAAAPWSTTRADEPFLQFLDGLREREMFDAALMYLDDIEKSPLANETIKLRIPYERGKTLVDSTRSDRDPKSKGRALDQARDELQAFVKANPSHPFAGAATLELGKVVYERGRLYAEMMATPKNAPQKDQLAKQARTYFDESIKVFSDAETRFDKRLAELPKGAIDPKEKALVEEREQVRNDFVSANLFVAAVYQELAKTYPKTAKEFKDNMGKAVDKNKKIYERFRTRMGGQWAHVKQGECLQEMDEWKAAIGVYQDILAQPDDAPEFRKLQGAALYRKLQCHLEMKDYELAAKIGEEWLAKLRGQEDEQPDWLSGRYYTAFAEKHQADGLAEGDKNKAALLKTVRQHLQLVVRYPNRNRDDARQLLTSVTGKEDERKEPTNFAEAAERIQELREEMVVKEELAGKVGPGEKEEAAKAAAEIAKIRDDIMKYCNVALALRDKTTTAEQLMEIRYLLSYMYYQNGRYYDAAVLAEFLARRYPDRSLARPAAMIAVFAYLKEYQDPTPQIKESNQFERDKLSSLASFISTRWKDEPDAADAWAILVGVAVGERDIKSAAEAITHVPESSPKRGDCEVRLGKAYWSAFQSELRKPPEERGPQSQTDALSKQARQLLEAGLAKIKQSSDFLTQFTADTFLGVLTNAEIYLSANEADKAVALLNDEQIGALKLLRDGNPIALTEIGAVSFPIETYKTALRAYIGAKDINSAQAIMGDLEKLMDAKGPSGKAELTKVYVSMGRALEEQIKAENAAGRPDEARKIGNSFEVFLQKISEAEAGANFSALNWVADTFYSLGVGFEDGTGKPATGDAASYFAKSLATDEKIMKMAASDPTFLPVPEMLNVIKMRVARTDRKLGKYQEAVDLIVSILKASPMLIDAQIEGARSYMDWGNEKPDNYAYSIVGAVPDANKKNTIVGWIQLINMLNRALANPQFAENPQAKQRFKNWLYECYHNMIEARIKYADVRKGDDKIKGLKRAQSDVNLLVRTNPDLVTETEWKDWFDRFNTQMKTVQKLLGEKPAGIDTSSATAKPVEDPNAAAATEAAAS